MSLVVYKLPNIIIWHSASVCISLCSTYNRVKCAHVDLFLWLTASKRWSHYAILLSEWVSEWVSVTIESEATTDSDDFDPIFLNLSPLFRNIVGCSTFVEDSLECPRMLLRISTLLHEKSSICHVLSNLPSHLTPSTRRWVFFFHNFLNHLISGVRIKRSCLCSYGELVSKEFSFQFSRKCMTPSRSSALRYGQPSWMSVKTT